MMELSYCCLLFDELFGPVGDDLGDCFGEPGGVEFGVVGGVN